MLTSPLNRRFSKLVRRAGVALCALAVLAFAAPASGAPNRPAPKSTPYAYWGAWIGDQLTGTAAPWDMNAVSQFESLAHKPLSLLEFGSPWADCSSGTCSYYAFPWTPFNDIRAHGAIPFLSWGSQSLPFNVNDPNFQLADIINGNHDAYITSFAQKAKEWGHPFFLRFDHEMNGNWFPWAEGANGNSVGQYVTAWRHVHDIFTSVGATNVNWVWCPYVNPTGNLQSLPALYPGSSYVDWTCLDGFNWGGSVATPGGTWRSFDYLFNPTYHEIADTIAPGKSMVIAEVASTEIGGSKAGWISNMFNALATSYPAVRGLIWFEQYDHRSEGNVDWPIETSATATNSFVKGIANTRYATNRYSQLSTSPIPPPGR